ncbi:MAG: hypothetical protein JNJ54_07520 [Myxococcaceae bacterium]|nr:hypothetical protein [Myxococcaceae bacterium]
MTWALVLSALAAEPSPLDEVPRQTAVFYNARVAHRRKRPVEVLTLWLLRNSLADAGKPGTHDGPFRSVVWAATGAMGLCQDGFARDDDATGAGLWPLGLHNHVLLARQPDELPSPYEAYDVGRQQRLITLHDVLDDEELESVSFSQTFCFSPRVALLDFGLDPLGDLNDRLVSGPLLRRLLLKALETVKRDQVTTVAAIEARLFDLELALTELRSRRKKDVALEAASEVRGANMSEGAASQAGEQAAKTVTDSRQVAFLRRTLRWQPAEWLTLSRQRREFLFANARQHSTDPDGLRDLTLGIVDLLVTANEGQEVMGWIGTLEIATDRELVFGGARGERLLALDEGSGFRERSVIALHRGVAQLERGALADALRSFAFALKHSDSSRAAATVHPLARRWLSYVLARYETNVEVLATLKALVPRQDFNPIIEDLLWAAALRTDGRSFDRLAETAQRGGSFDQKVQRLAPLAHGRAGDLVNQLQASAQEGPYDALRFTRQLVDMLEREEADVRRANRALLSQLIALLEGIALQENQAKTNEKVARELAGRVQALLEAMGSGAGPNADSRALNLSHSAFAGSLRLAPADPLPWPFAPPAVEAPPAFTPFQLVPIEWRDEQGRLVFGWRITE